MKTPKKRYFVSVRFAPKDDKEYTYELSPDNLDIVVGDFVVVEVQGGTYKFPFGLARVSAVGLSKPKFQCKFIHSKVEELV